VALGRYDEAVEAFSVATRYEPGRRNGLVGLVWTAIRAGDDTAAAARSERLMDQYPVDRWGRWLRGIVLRRAGRSRQAAGIIRELLADDPLWYRANAEAVLLGVPTRLAGGQRHLADESVVAATDYLAMGLWDDAATILGYEDSDEPFSPAVRLAHLAYAHHRRGEAKAAKGVLRQLARAPVAHAEPWTTASIDFLTELAEAYPDQAMVRLLLGNVLASRRRLDEAVAAWRKAQRLGLEHAVIYRNLAAAAEHQGQRDKAIRLYRRAWKLAKPDLYLFDEFDRVLAAAGRHRERDRLYRDLPRKALGRSIVALRRVPQLLDLERYDEALEELRIRTFLGGGCGGSPAALDGGGVGGALGLRPDPCLRDAGVDGPGQPGPRDAHRPRLRAVRARGALAARMVGQPQRTRHLEDRPRAGAVGQGLARPGGRHLAPGPCRGPGRAVDPPARSHARRRAESDGAADRRARGLAVKQANAKPVSRGGPPRAPAGGGAESPRLPPPAVAMAARLFHAHLRLPKGSGPRRIGAPVCTTTTWPTGPATRSWGTFRPIRHSWYCPRIRGCGLDPAVLFPERLGLGAPGACPGTGCCLPPPEGGGKP